jgi:hypothetical protein
VVGKRNEGLLVRAELLQWAQGDLPEDGGCGARRGRRALSGGRPGWAGAIDTVMVTKGVRVNELRKESVEERLIA